MSSFFDITMNVKTGDYLMTNKTIEEKMKQVEGMFFNAMDVLRLHKNTKWSEVTDRVDDEVVLEQILEGFLFEEKYGINAYHNRFFGFGNTSRNYDKTLEVEERKFIDKDGDVHFDYNVMETQLDTNLPENIQMNLQVFGVSEKRNTANVFVNLNNEDFGYSGNTAIEIDFDTFKLKSREIGKIRSLFKDALTQNEQLLQKIERMKRLIESNELHLVKLKKYLEEMTRKFAGLNPMKEVA